MLPKGEQIGYRFGNPINLEHQNTQYDTSSIEPKSLPPPPPQLHAYPYTIGINDLRSSTYRKKWSIKVRVTKKTEITRYSNKNGKGIYFKMDLQDDSGQICVTAFNEIADKFYDMIEVSVCNF